MAYMNEQFAPLETKLACLREYGQIEFDVLPYHFEPGMKLAKIDCATGRPDAFVLTSRSMGQDMQGRFLALNGYAYRFDGDQYVQRPMRTKVRTFQGTRLTESLAAVELSAALEAELMGKCVSSCISWVLMSVSERGRLYTTFAGVHHKEYLGKRVIVDPKAYTNQEGYERDPKAIIRPLAEDMLYLLPPDIEGFNLSNKV
jgi:hypothetical protein